ncbi:MAG: hypothetical protein WBY53_17480 [Acidobacteriaceae bacterium]
MPELLVTRLALLDEGYRQRSTNVLRVDRDPAFDFLHGDARYRELVREVGEPTAK